jgi:molybdopterin-guanine dinucleotide biosynthesis protein A
MTSLPVDQITGLILAGGRGVRVGGVDKGLLSFHQEKIVQRVLRSLKPQAQLTLVSANRHIEEYESLGVPVIKDRLADYQGPLAGIEAALSVCPTPYMAVVPCDAPFISQDLLALLYERMEVTNANIVYAEGRGQDGQLEAEPMFALIRTCMLSSLRQYLGAGRRKVLAWYQSTDHASVLIENSLCFANANTPEDFESLQLQAKNA